MTIECYISDCPHHAYFQDDEEGPFCYREHCAWTSEQIEAKAYLDTPKLKLVKDDTPLELRFVSELFGKQDDKGIVMKGLLIAPDLKDAFRQAMAVWPFDNPPFAINLGPYEEEEEEASDADVHRT